RVVGARARHVGAWGERSAPESQVDRGQPSMTPIPVVAGLFQLGHLKRLFFPEGSSSWPTTTCTVCLARALQPQERVTEFVAGFRCGCLPDLTTGGVAPAFLQRLGFFVRTGPVATRINHK